MCQKLEIARSAYYKWLNHKPSKHEVEDQYLTDRIIAIANSNNSLFGAGKMMLELNKTLSEGESRYGHNRVARIMCINGIRCSVARYNKPKRPNKPSGNETAENILNRDFNASAPDEKWGIDITEVTAPGVSKKAYLATMIDLYDKSPVGYAISDHNDVALVQKAIDAAFEANPNAHPLIHSDRGFQFTRKPFKVYLKNHGATQSMSRVSHCIDNAPVEGWQGRIKDIRTTLFPHVHTYDELVESIHKAIKYYIESDPQKRFGGKTAGEVRAEALAGKVYSYPIPKNNRIIKYWAKINAKKQKE